jgi:hypothetical protein
LQKAPDARYQSAYGLKADLLECQRRLLTTVSSTSEQSTEVWQHIFVASPIIYKIKISSFRFSKLPHPTDTWSVEIPSEFLPRLSIYVQSFTMPTTLVRRPKASRASPAYRGFAQFGREKELELVRQVIRRTSTNFSLHVSSSKGSALVSQPNSSCGTPLSPTAETDGFSDNLSRSDESMPLFSNRFEAESPLYERSSNSVSKSPEAFRRSAFQTSKKNGCAQAAVIVGPPG